MTTENGVVNVVMSPSSKMEPKRPLLDCFHTNIKGMLFPRMYTRVSAALTYVTKCPPPAFAIVIVVFTIRASVSVPACFVSIS